MSIGGGQEIHFKHKILFYAPISIFELHSSVTILHLI